jgi:predicted phosphohydrolase
MIIINSAVKFILSQKGKTMSLYAIADLHLCTGDEKNKSMEVFGTPWADYVNRIEQAWRRLISSEDTVVIPGDISWSLSLEGALSDLKFIDALPGKKILGKGNHDFWWTTMKKHGEFFEKNSIKTISFLFNSAFIADDFIVVGTRGWYNDEDASNIPSGTDFEKLTRREAQRLEVSIKHGLLLKESAPEKELVAFLHFPPYWNGRASDTLIEVLKKYEIKRVFYGHIHGNYTVPPTFEYEGIDMSIVSADYLKFTPKLVK